MRTLTLVLIFFMPAVPFAQPAPAPPSARQAIIEMFFSDSPVNIFKHLPEATKAALMNGGEGLAFGPTSIASDLKRQGKTFQVYEAGPVLVSSTDSRTEEKFEVAIDRDDLIGDQDEIDLSFHNFRNGQEQALSNFLPRVNLKLGMEGGAWKLRELAFNLRLPLDDPDFLKALKEIFQDRQRVNDPAVSSLILLNMAETRYKSLHPERGFTCSLSELGTIRFGNASNSPPVIDSVLSSGTKDGYKFAITSCGSQPVSTYQLSASPTEAGKPAFCTDQAGVLKSAADGQAATCLTSGETFGSSSQNARGARVMLALPNSN